MTTASSTLVMPGQALRQALGEVLVELGSTDERVVVLDGDVATSSGAAPFEAAYPDRFVQTGIGEQNTLAMAAGLATVGHLPFVTGFAAFLVARALDSIRVLIAQPGLPVKIMGGYSGMAAGKTGKTHLLLNDLAIMRSFPGMTVIAPADSHELKSVVRALTGLKGPAYVQVGRDPSLYLFDESYQFECGAAVTLRDGADATVISTGIQSTRTYEATTLLARRGIHARMLHMPSVVPLDEDAIIAAARETGLIFTVEEQNVTGSLGGAVAEVVAARQPVTVHRLGIQCRYGESGTNEALYEKYRLSSQAIADDIEALLRSRLAPAHHG